MSLILEALKKSEQQRRLGEAPTLGSPVLVARKRRNLLPLFGVLIVAALAVGWWLTRTPQQEPDAPKTDTVAVAPAPAGQAAPAVKPAPAPHAPAARPPNANPATGAGSPPAANRTAAPATAPAKPPVATAPAAQPPPATAAPKTPAGPAAAPPAASTKPPAATPPAPTKPSAEGKPATPNATVAPTQPPAATRPAPAQPALPSVWDLPYATRKDLPELALTMHVYASAPADRFVVIKGERHVEGDELGDGVALKEIRADGMVLEFKGQRFIYPRDGR